MVFRQSGAAKLKFITCQNEGTNETVNGQDNPKRRSLKAKQKSGAKERPDSIFPVAKAKGNHL